MKTFRYRRSTIIIGVSCFMLGWAVHGSLNGGCMPLATIQQRLRSGLNTTKIRLPSKWRNEAAPREEQNQSAENVNLSISKEDDKIHADPSVSKDSFQNSTSSPAIITESTSLLQKFRTYRLRMNLSLPMEAKQHPDSPFMGAVDEVSHALCSKTYALILTCFLGFHRREPATTCMIPRVRAVSHPNLKPRQRTARRAQHR